MKVELVRAEVIDAVKVKLENSGVLTAENEIVKTEFSKNGTVTVEIKTKKLEKAEEV